MDRLLPLLVVEEIPEYSAVRVRTDSPCAEKEVNSLCPVVVVDELLDSGVSESLFGL
jgi:hypothetical protein